jgi:hypothetical protein
VIGVRHTRGYPRVYLSAERNGAVFLTRSFNVVVTDGRLTLRFELFAREQLAGLMTLFKLAGLFIGENSASDTPLALAAKSLLTNAIDIEEGVLTLTTAGLSAERIALIFSVFSACL